jgi:hypothetical protein
MTEPDKNPHGPSAGLEEQQSRLLSHALNSAGLRAGDLWLRYFSIGGNADEYEVDAYVQCMLPLPPCERDLLAHAANELIDELPPRPRAPYMQDLWDAAAELEQTKGIDRWGNGD